MLTLNCTRLLARRLPFPIVDEPLPSTNVLGPWCGNSFNAGRSPLVLFTNERTLLSVVIPFKEIRSVHIRFLASLEILLHSIALSSHQIQSELKQMTDVQFTRRTNRRTLGSMNDFVRIVLVSVERHPGKALEEISFDLSQIPCAPLSYGYPHEAALAVLDPLRR